MLEIPLPLKLRIVKLFNPAKIPAGKSSNEFDEK